VFLPRKTYENRAFLCFLPLSVEIIEDFSQQKVIHRSFNFALVATFDSSYFHPVSRQNGGIQQDMATQIWPGNQPLNLTAIKSMKTLWKIYDK